VRTCVGCRRGTGRAELVRLARAPDGTVVVDHPPRLGGRGAWVHASGECVAKAARRGVLSKAFAAQTSGDAPALVEALRGRVEDRVLGILASGRGARRLAVGTEAALVAIQSGEACLVGFAADARGDRVAVDLAAARADVPRVRMPAKDRLGQALGRAEVGVVAVTDGRLASAVGRELSILSSLAAPADSIEGNP
jgi:predicted RNA-binding protein YlxR (DUF448 family)